MMGDWTFFSNHGHVLVCLDRDRRARLRDVAVEVGITERAVQKIVRDLQDEGFLSVTKQGRCNRYRINRRKSLRHQLESHCTVGKLLSLMARADTQDTPRHSEHGPEPVQDEPAVEPVSARKSPEDENAASRKPRSPSDDRGQGTLF